MVFGAWVTVCAAVAISTQGRHCWRSRVGRGIAPALRRDREAGAARDPAQEQSTTRPATRRLTYVAVIAALAMATTHAQLARSSSGLTFAFTEIGARAGLAAVTVYGGVTTNRYLLETTGTGVAAFDYDSDGWLDAFVVNGTTLEGFPKGKEPTSHLYRNKRDGTFEDVTARAGLGASGWGQGACTGDYDNDGDEDLYVTYYGQNRLYRNAGDGTFAEVTTAA